jgi:DNA-binding NarL/FixJ family response regulator
MAVRIAVQERQRFFREGLAMVLAGEPDLDVVGAVRAASELNRVCEDERPDVVLLEIDVDEWDACRLAAALRTRLRTVRIVGVAGAVDRVLALRSYQAGVRNVVARDGGITAVLAAVRSLGSVGPVVTALPPARVAAATDRNSLTSRELDVLHLVGGGNTTREVSHALGISPKTVENHKQRIFAKLGVQNQAHAVAVAMRAGLLSPATGLRPVVSS